MRVNIKPLSVNECWRGRRFKTDKYSIYERNVLMLLKPMKTPIDKIYLKVKIGLSSKNADIDNVLKPFIDILQIKYSFNDKNIFKITIEKEIVKKKAEFIDFQLLDYKETQ